MKMIINRFSKRFVMVILLCTLMTSFIMFTDVTPFSTSHVYAAVQATYYVATDGSDSNPGTLSQPFATIQKARDVVRTINSDMTGDIIVYIRAGDYSIADTVTFNESDSGTNGFKIYYKNYDAIGSARFLGGQAVTGWTLDSGNIYKANVGTSWVFNDLWENGVRAVKARTPNINSGYPLSTTCQGPYFTNETYSDTSKSVFKYKSGDLDPTGWVLSDMQVQIFSGGYYNWIIDLEPISSIDSSNRLIYLSEDCSYALPALSRYYVQGDKSLLDAPGEYYLNKSTGYLYYYPRSTPISSQTIVAPKVTDIFKLYGSSETQLVKNIQFEGLAFEFSDYIEKEPANPASMDSLANGIFNMRNTQYVTIKNCHLKNSGIDGICMKYFNENVTIYGNWIEQSGRSGIHCFGYAPIESGRSNCNRDHVFKNNKIEFLGMHCTQSAGIDMLQTGHVDLSNNYVAYGPRWLLGSGTWLNYPQADSYFENNSICYNELFKGMQDSADGAPAYWFGTVYASQANTINQMNVDTSYWDTNAGLTTSSLEPWGVYFDNGSNYWNCSNVVCTNIQDLQYYSNGTNETITNCSWQSGFNDSLIDYKNIGLKPDFPSVYGGGAGYTFGNDNDAGFTYSSGWAYSSNSVVEYDFSGDEHYTNTAGLDAQFTFNGTDIKWLASTSNNRGKADVYIDNVFDSTVDLYTDNVIRQNTVYTKTGLSQGSHTIKIVTRDDKNSSSGGYYVVIDAIGYKTFSEDGFENYFDSWTTVCGTPSTSTLQKHNGTHSYVINEDADMIQHDMGSNTNKVAVIWFYDDASDISMQTVGGVDNTTTPMMTGVETITSTTKYVYRIGNTWTATSINRTTGWHQFVWDYRSGTDVKLYIDGTQITSSTAVTSFNRIYMGDAWSNGTTGTVYFDDVSVQDNLP